MSPALVGKLIIVLITVFVYRLCADASSTLGVRLRMDQVCSVEFEAFKLRKSLLLCTFLAQFKLIANTILQISPVLLVVLVRGKNIW